MGFIRLLCWDEDAARQHARDLKKAGFTVDASKLVTRRFIGQFRDNPPSAILIDLDRRPSHGRTVAMVLKGAKSTRYIPIVLAGGEEEKVQQARRYLPSAVFTTWTGVAAALKKAIKTPAMPGPKTDYMSQWHSTSLSKKLGFKANMKTSLLGAPDGFEELLADLPDGVDLQTSLSARTQMAIWFVRSRRELDEETLYITARLPAAAALWIVYPKQTGRFRADFVQKDVRAAALAAGFVDYKICAVDADWTGLKFGRKRS